MHRRSGKLETLSGGRWTSFRALAADVAIAFPFWVLWEGTAYAVNRVLGPSNAKSVGDLLPRSLLEILLWIAVSITAGFCEEIAFRGYLQRQLHALGGSVAVAVLAQAFVFGLAHGYQGWKAVIVISVLGVLYGVPRRMATKSTRQYNRACVVRRLVRLAEYCDLDVARAGEENSSCLPGFIETPRSH